MGGSPDDTAAAIAAGLAAIWERSRETVLGRVSTVDAAAAAAIEGSLPLEQRRMAEHDAHKLAGILGTFGFQTASPLAFEAERLLRGDVDLSPETATALRALAALIRDELSV